MLTPGQRVEDRYVVEAVIGRGGLAEVYRVRHLQLGSLHALKVLLFKKKKLADRLLLEGRIQAQLRHPNVVAVTDIIQLDGQFGLLMEYVDNLTLEELIDSRGAIPVDEALECVAPVIAGVHAAHAAGVLHRDLKPANVLLARVGGGLVPKVSDFGIAKVLDEVDSDTRDNVAMGTPGYMAPEQVLDAKSVDVRTDVFALAGMVYELIAGRRAFEDDRGEVTIRSTLECNVIPLHEADPTVPERVSRAVSKALSRDRDDRPATVLAFAEELLADHPHLLAMVRGTASSEPITLEPTAYGSESSEPEDEDEDVIVGRLPGPTIAPQATSTLTPDSLDTPQPASPRPAGARSGKDPDTIVAFAEDSDGDAEVAAPLPEPVEEEPDRGGAPRFATGLLLVSGLLLVGLTLTVLVVGPALGWFVTPDGAAVLAPDGVAAEDGEGVGEPIGETAGQAVAGGPEAGMADEQVDEIPEEGAIDEENPEIEATADPAAAGTTEPDETPSADPSTPATTTIPPTAPDGLETDPDPTEEPAASADPPLDETEPADATTQAASGTTEPATEPDGSGTTEPATAPDASGTTEADPTPAPAPRRMVMAPDVLIAASWQGKVYRQPFTLRIVSDDGGDVVAEGRIVIGAQQRLVRMAGTYDPWSGALVLEEINGSLMLKGAVTDSGIRGVYRRKDKGSEEPLDLSRR